MVVKAHKGGCSTIPQQGVYRTLETVCIERGAAVEIDRCNPMSATILIIDAL